MDFARELRRGASQPWQRELERWRRYFRFDPAYNHCVYFIRSRQTGEIKIGRSWDPKRRFNEISGTEGAGPLSVLLVVRGAEPELEAALHRAFHSTRTVGEWFVPSVELWWTMHCLAGSGHEDERYPMNLPPWVLDAGTQKYTIFGPAEEWLWVAEGVRPWPHAYWPRNNRWMRAARAA